MIISENETLFSSNGYGKKGNIKLCRFNVKEKLGGYGVSLNSLLLHAGGADGALARGGMVCVSASSPAQASSSSRAVRRELCVSSFTQKQPACAQRRRVRVAAKRFSERGKAVVEKPLQYEGEEDDVEGDEEYVRPQLPGEEPDFWEGPQFEILGFIVQYLWAIGIVVALGGCLIAVRSYNEGAGDFKETEVYKDAMESQGFLEVPSDSKVFEEPPLKDSPPVVEQESSS